MLTPIVRTAIFKSHPFIDNYIAGMQQAYGADFNFDNLKEAARLKKYYDHLLPFQPIDTSTNKYGEMAYPAGSKADYVIHFPKQLAELLINLDITDLFLMQSIKMDFIAEFPFENYSKKNRFKRMGGVKSANIGYRFNVNNLPAVLPLFLFARHYDTPVIYLFSADAAKPLALRLCDDGNLHYNIPAAQHQAFIHAANASGFVTDGEDLCGRYSVYYFNKAQLVGNTLQPVNL